MGKGGKKGLRKPVCARGNGGRREEKDGKRKSGS